MKKKVKRIPKYNTGTISAQSLLDQTLGQGTLGTSGYTPTMGSTNANGGSSNGALGIAGGIASAISGASGVVANALDIEQGKNAAIFNVAGDVAQMIPGIGQILGPALKTVGAFAGEGGDVDQNTGEINKSSGLTRVLGFGRKDKSLYAESNRIKNAIQSKVHTENIRTDYMNNPNAPGLINLNAAEGAIVRKPLGALVSKGELIYDPITKELTKVPGDKGKPNTDDDQYKILLKGQMVVPNSEKSERLTTNGKTAAYNLTPMIDKPNKKMSPGTIEARDRIVKKVVFMNEMTKNEPQQYAMYSEGTPYVQLGKDPINELEEELFKSQTPEITGKDRRWVYRLAKAGETMSDYLPMISTLLKNYDYQRVQPRIGKNRNIPVDYNINDILTDNQIANAINNYNVSQIGGGTGAYLAAANQSAANLMKANSQARIYQKNKQNELIGKNIVQLNDWERYANNQLWAADVATAQNQGMAQQMRDQAIKDAYEYQTGRRNDRWKLSMLEPLFQYAVDDNIWKKFKTV